MADSGDLSQQEQWEWMLRHVQESRVPLIIIICTIGTFLTLVFLGLRLWSRKLAFGYLKLDLSDMLCIAAVFFTLMLTTDVLVGIRYGAGRHLPAIKDVRSLYVVSALSSMSRAAYVHGNSPADRRPVFIVANAAHPPAMCGLKLSLLALFYRLFPSRNFRLCCWAMAVFIVLWAVVSIVMGVALCIPMQKLWDPTITGGYCLPLATMGLATTSTHIFTDFALLLMPVPLVLKLKTTRKNKILVISTFMVGGTVCIISIIRLPLWLLSGTSGDFGWDNIPGAMLAITVTDQFKLSTHHNGHGSWQKLSG